MSDRSEIERYQAFRIGNAKYSRLAQINLHSRIITFSRFAVENVPERGRRYLVLHELAHVKEANHNKRFWQHVELYEPNYKQISRELESAFKHNVREEQHKLKSLKLDSPFADPNRIPGSGLLNYKFDRSGNEGGDRGEDSVTRKQSVIISPEEASDEES